MSHALRFASEVVRELFKDIAQEMLINKKSCKCKKAFGYYDIKIDIIKDFSTKVSPVLTTCFKWLWW